MRERNRTPVRVTDPRRKPDARDIVIRDAMKGSGEEPLLFFSGDRTAIAWTIGALRKHVSPFLLTDEL
jgi:hypothetical protein